MVIRRGQIVEAVPAVAPAPAISTVPAAPAAAAPAPVAVAEAPAEETTEDGYETIVSPIVGTFYRSPSPDSEPYAEVGSVL